MISMPVYYSVGRFASLGRLNLYKSEIKLWYDLQNYKAIDEWIDIDKYIDAKEIIKGFKFYKLFVLTIIVGKFIFYSGIIILCFL